MRPRLHILGHPDFPLGPGSHPEDSQLFNCWNFCQLAEVLEIPYAYYGVSESQLPPGKWGQVVDIGLPLSRWSFRNRWHDTYTKRLQKALVATLNSDDEPEWIASIYGVAQCDLEPIPGIPILEPLVGYGNCWSHYRVFPSYAHQANLYASQPEVRKDCFFDTVIPHFVNPDDYGIADTTGDYLCYLGRNAPAKGVAIAQEVADAVKRPLKAVFSGCYGEDKRRLLAEAHAVLMPTLYQEPFGYVAIEAMLCGTPVITTDWGSFPELIQDGVNGFRCRTAAEFAAAVRDCATLDRQAIRRLAVQRFSVQAVAPQYRRYLNFVWEAHRHGGYYAPAAIR